MILKIFKSIENRKLQIEQFTRNLVSKYLWNAIYKRKVEFIGVLTVF